MIIGFQILITIHNLFVPLSLCINNLTNKFIGNFDFDSMNRISPILGPIAFFLYMFTVFFVLVNMFLTILNESFKCVRGEMSLQNNDFEVVDFMLKKLKVFINYKSLKEVTQVYLHYFANIF